MTSIMNLPIEVVALILENLGSVQNLDVVLLSCQLFYSAFCARPSLAASILRQQMPDSLLFYAVTADAAACLRPSLSLPVVEAFFRDYFEDPGSFPLAAKEMTMSLTVAKRLEATHRAVDFLARQFARGAWQALFPGNPAMGYDVDVSETEDFRLCRAFYRVETFYKVFCEDQPGWGLDVYRGNENRLFLSQLSPWEMEQMACAHRYLERSFTTMDLYNHHVHHPTLRRPGWTQWGVAQGVKYMQRMMTEPSLTVKFYLDGFGPTQAHDAALLSQPLVSHFEPALGPGRFGTATLEEVRAVAVRPDSQDADDGPLIAWKHAHRLSCLPRWRMEKRLGDVRERAHVFWDQARVDEYGLMEMNDKLFDHPDYMLPAYALTLT